MRSAWIVVALLGGCASDLDGTIEMVPDPSLEPVDEAAVPRTCSQTVALYGMTGNAQGETVPVTVDTAGTTLCLELDARDNIQVGHFAAGTPYEAGTQSSYKLDLFDALDQPVRSGWDVQFGSGADARAFTNLEYGVTKGELVPMKLVVRARAGTATTDLHLALFEPYE